MNRNPVNLAVRFLLELAMLFTLGYWGSHRSGTWEPWAAAIAIPLAAAVLWGVFRIPNDPKAAPVAVPGIVRLLLEWMLFASAVLALSDLHHTRAARILAVVIIVHYIVSYDRTWAMLRNKPYRGFK